MPTYLVSNVNQDTREGLAFLNFLLPLLGGLGGAGAAAGTLGTIATIGGGVASLLGARNAKEQAEASQRQQQQALADSEAQSAAAYRSSLRSQGGRGTGDFGGTGNSTFNTALKSLTGR